MYSFENIYKYGISKTVFSIPTLLFGLSGVIEQKSNIFGTIIFLLFIIVGSYVNFFNFLRSYNQPTPHLYKTNIPTFLFQMVIFYIVFSFLVSVFFKFIK